MYLHKFTIKFIQRDGTKVTLSDNSSTNLLEIAGSARIITLTKNF